MRRYITSLIVWKPKLKCLWIECLCVGQQNLNRGCYVSYFATFIFVTISCSFHNFFMGRVYHTKTFDFRMWKNYLVITLSISVGLWEYCAIRSLLQNLVYCFYRSMVLFIATAIVIYPEFLLFSGEIERENWTEFGYVHQDFIPPRIINKTILSQTKKISDFQ